mgnify:CR=1 FL=1
MSELYAITITGIIASEHGDPINWWSGDTQQIFDMSVTSQLFAVNEDGKISLVNEAKEEATHDPIEDPDNLIGDALDDANGFYEMFEGWEGVEERVERLHQAFEVMDKSGAIQRSEHGPRILAQAEANVPVVVKVNAFDETGFATPSEVVDAFASHIANDAKCSECGQSFERHHVLQKYCGDICRKARNARWYREYKKKEVK